MDYIRAAAIYNNKGHICGALLFHSGECVKYILSKDKGGKGLLVEVVPSILGMTENVYEAIFATFIRNMNWEFSRVYEYDVINFRKTFDNIIDEINKTVNATLS